MYIEHPYLYVRSCEKCKKYFYFDNKIQKDATGKLIERGLGQEPNCKLCEKYDEELDIVWDGFTERNKYVFNVFLSCKFFSTLPYEGGVLDQEPWLMELCNVLAQLFEQGTEYKNKEWQIDLAKMSAGVKL